MSALDDLIADFTSNRTAEGQQPLKADVDNMIAALQFLAATSSAPLISAGRLTLTTGVPVLIADVVDALSTFFTPFNGNKILINSGNAVFVATTFAELSQTLADATKSPAAAVANSNYDMFVWLDGATVRCTRGPVWATDTARAAGGAISRVTGILVNTLAIANGPAALMGTYVGTIRTTATPGVSMLFAPAAAAGGAGNVLGLFNYYNRVPVSSTNRDSTATWAYNTATWRARNNNALNGISFIIGVDEQAFLAETDIVAENSAAGNAVIGFGLDSVTVLHAASPAVWCATQVAGKFGAASGAFSAFPGIGFHTVTPLEQGATATTTWRNNTTGAACDARGSMRLRLEM